MRQIISKALRKITTKATAATIEATYKDIPVAKYTLTITNGSGSGDYAENTAVTITADASAAGKVFDKWVLKSGSADIADENSAATTVTTKATAATIEATYRDLYKIINGANGVWVKGSTDTLSFKADGDLAKFTSVKIDGTELATDKYTAAAGSTVITLKNDYLSTLAVGAHTIAIIYDDGDCSTNFTVHQHTYGAWSSDDTHHWHECTDASCPDKTASRIDKAEHTFEWKIDVPASQASTGTKHEECTVCGKKRSEGTVIDKLPGSSSGSGSHHSSSNNNNNNTGTEAAAPEAAAPAPAASAPVTTTTSARTGDSSNLIGWLAALFVSGGVLTVLGLNGKKRKESEDE